MASKIDQQPQGDIDEGIREAELRARAHELWVQEGRPEGRHDEHWQKAREELERRLNERVGQHHHPNTPEQVERALDARGSIDYDKDSEKKIASGSGDRGPTP